MVESMMQSNLDSLPSPLHGVLEHGVTERQSARAPRLHGVEIALDVEQAVQQRSASESIVGQETVQARLLLRRRVADRSGRALAARETRVVGLGPPGEHVGRVVATRQHGDLGERAAARRVQRHRQRGRPYQDLVAAVAVHVGDRDLDGRRTARQLGLGLQQRALHRPAQVREIAAAEHAVPVGVVGLAAPQRLARLRPRAGSSGRRGECSRVTAADSRSIFQ